MHVCVHVCSKWNRCVPLGYCWFEQACGMSPSCSGIISKNTASLTTHDVPYPVFYLVLANIGPFTDGTLIVWTPR